MCSLGLLACNGDQGVLVLYEIELTLCDLHNFSMTSDMLEERHVDFPDLLQLCFPNISIGLTYHFSIISYHRTK